MKLAVFNIVGIIWTLVAVTVTGVVVVPLAGTLVWGGVVQTTKVPSAAIALGTTFSEDTNSRVGRAEVTPKNVPER